MTAIEAEPEEKIVDCSNCQHWHYSSSLNYVCDCSDKIGDSIDAITHDKCDKWELAAWHNRMRKRRRLLSL